MTHFGTRCIPAPVTPPPPVIPIERKKADDTEGGTCD